MVLYDIYPNDAFRHQPVHGFQGRPSFQLNLTIALLDFLVPQQGCMHDFHGLMGPTRNHLQGCCYPGIGEAEMAELFMRMGLLGRGQCDDYAQMAYESLVRDARSSGKGKGSSTDSERRSIEQWLESKTSPARLLACSGKSQVSEALLRQIQEVRTRLDAAMCNGVITDEERQCIGQAAQAVCDAEYAALEGWQSDGDRGTNRPATKQSTNRPATKQGTNRTATEQCTQERADNAPKSDRPPLTERGAAPSRTGLDFGYDLEPGHRGPLVEDVRLHLEQQGYLKPTDENRDFFDRDMADALVEWKKANYPDESPSAVLQNRHWHTLNNDWHWGAVGWGKGQSVDRASAGDDPGGAKAPSHYAVIHNGATVNPGDYGPLVEEIQDKLNMDAKGVPYVRGRMDAPTIAALKDYQATLGLTETGFGKETIGQLLGDWLVLPDAPWRVSRGA